jgi:tripartite-type tricarboxylate transporter receptor subunit TctC
LRHDALFVPSSTFNHSIVLATAAAWRGTALRLGVLPALTISEQGWLELQGEIWAGLVAPAGVPHEVIEKLADAANKAVRSDDVASTLNALGFYPLGGSPADFSQFIAREINKWSAAAKAAGLKE